MTTMELPSVGGYFAMRLARIANKRKERSATRMRTWYQTIVRLVLHIAGFSLLTMAGFWFNMPAGLITAAVSCFVLSHLMTSRTEETDTDPMRR